jgi:hypothetical protein
MKKTALVDAIVNLNIVRKNLEQAVTAAKQLGGRQLNHDEWTKVHNTMDNEQIKNALLAGQSREANCSFITILNKGNNIIDLTYFCECLKIPADLKIISKMVSYHFHHPLNFAAANILAAILYVKENHSYYGLSSLPDTWFDQARKVAITAGDVKAFAEIIKLTKRGLNNEELEDILTVCANNYATVAPENTIPPEDKEGYEYLLSFLPESEAYIYRKFIFAT